MRIPFLAVYSRSESASPFAAHCPAANNLTRQNEFSAARASTAYFSHNDQQQKGILLPEHLPRHYNHSSVTKGTMQDCTVNNPNYPDSAGSP